MKELLRRIYYFLPVQLFLLHFRKYQLLLLFWLVLVLTLTGNFASHFGASALFLSPEYLGKINFGSMFLLGCAMGVFIMTWNITTFIIHSKRLYFIGASRHAFHLYCYNNALLPLLFLIFYSISITHYQWYYEHASPGTTFMLQLGFYLGILVVVIISFAYFFRVGRDVLKAVLSTIAKPSRVREIIPYDTLDYEVDMIHCRSYLSERMRVSPFSSLEPYHPRLMNTVLRGHHRNAIFATFVSYLVLVLLGIFMDNPLLRIPAGGSFLIFFSIIMGLAGAMKYFLKSWETIGLVLLATAFSLLVHYNIIDLRSVAYGINYQQPAAQQPNYSYQYLRRLFTPARYYTDKATEEQRLQSWKRVAAVNGANPPLVVITISGGGTRSAYWSFHALQYIDSLTGGGLFRNTVLVTGASGGMIGAAYWRCLHADYQKGRIKELYNPQYQENIGKDLLNPIVFSLVSVDLVSPFNGITVNGRAYTKDRGYALEQELVRNTGGVLDKTIGDMKDAEAAGMIPQMIINGTVINDGRKLMISGQPVGYLTQPEYALKDTATPPIDAIDYAAFFAGQSPYDMRITSALRMNATFPVVLPVVKLPSQPRMNVMDAGLRDNFGTEVASRYLFALRDWMTKNAGNVIFLEIRDTKEYEISPPTEQTSLANMLADPMFVIQNKWEAFQSYNHTYLKDYAPHFMGGKLRFVTLQYVPQESQKVAALNFHLSQKEKEDLYASIRNKDNSAAVDTLLRLLR